MKNFSLKKRVLSGGAWTFAGKVLTAFTGLAANALLARLLSPEELGAYFLTLSLVSAAAIFAQLGLTKTVIRLVAESMGTEQPARARLAVIWVIRLTGLGTLLTASLLLFGLGAWIAERLFHSSMMVPVVGLATLWVMFLTFQQLMAEIFRGFHDIRLATIFGGLVTSLLSMLLFLILWLLRGSCDLEKVILAMLVAGFTSVFLSSLALGKKLKNLQVPRGDEIRLVEIFTISWPLWITSLTIFALVQADIWIVGAFRSAEEVAVYGATVRIVTIVTMPLLIVNAVVPPLISEMYAQGKIEKLERTLRTVATFAGVPSLIVLGVFIFWGDSILGLIFGNYYRTGGTILAILSMGQLANVWAGSSGLTLMLTGHQMTMLLITILSGFLTVTAACLLVQNYGYVGVATAFATGMVLQNLLMLLFAKKKTGIWTHVNPMLLREVRSYL